MINSSSWYLRVTLPASSAGRVSAMIPWNTGTPTYGCNSCYTAYPVLQDGFLKFRHEAPTNLSGQLQAYPAGDFVVNYGVKWHSGVLQLDITETTNTSFNTRFYIYKYENDYSPNQGPLKHTGDSPTIITIPGATKVEWVNDSGFVGPAIPAGYNFSNQRVNTALRVKFVYDPTID